MDMETLVDAIETELKRNRELLRQYREIGPAGAFAFAMIEKLIGETNRAVRERDTVAMVRCCKALQGSK